MSIGDLTEGLEGIRTGSIPGPPVDKVAALASVFGIHPSYFLDKCGQAPLIDREAREKDGKPTLPGRARHSPCPNGTERNPVFGFSANF
jgi:hypothetical protein